MGFWTSGRQLGTWQDFAPKYRVGGGSEPGKLHPCGNVDTRQSIASLCCWAVHFAKTKELDAGIVRFSTEHFLFAALGTNCFRLLYVRGLSHRYVA